jgi:hypothetical protein
VSHLADYPVLKCTVCGWLIQQIDIPYVELDPATFVCLSCDPTVELLSEVTS